MAKRGRKPKPPVEWAFTTCKVWADQNIAAGIVFAKTKQEARKKVKEEVLKYGDIPCYVWKVTSDTKLPEEAVDVE